MCFSELPSYNSIIGTLLEHGLQELPKHCKLTPGETSLYTSVQSLDHLGHGGWGMRDNSAEILFQSFLQEAL